MRRVRLLLASLRRVSGVTTPVGGVSWTPSPSERDELRRLVVFLEDRRALFDPYNIEATVLVEHSVQEIRAELTKVLQRMGETSRAGEPLRTMRAACQRYLSQASGFRDEPYWHRRPRHGGPGFDEADDDFIMALGELRGVFGACLGQIALSYEIEVHGQLAELLPGREEDGRP
ncbi:MAG TPA: DUF6650 family protein [Gaiellaceae bacterium]|nr:DUF6650 family protein [Gaiellaceae bacterium]